MPIAHELSVTIPPPMRGDALATPRGRVLVIDDEEILVHAIERGLAAHHDVTGMSSGVRAVELIRGGARFDVVLCDLMMPQVSGMELYTTVAALDPEQASRIVFVTGGAFTQTARQFLDTTKNRRIEKPFDLRDLRAVVDAVIAEVGTSKQPR
jgi:CheY-like chemotaxis protein